MYFLKKLFILFVSLSFFSFYSCDIENFLKDELDPKEEQQEENGDKQKEEEEDDDNNTLPTLTGYQLALNKGDYWEFYWNNEGYTSWWASYGTNTTNTEDSGFVTITLGNPITVSGKTLFSVSITGDIPKYWEDSFWTALGVDGNSFIGSKNNVTVETIINGDNSKSEASFFLKYSVPLEIKTSSISATTPVSYTTTGHKATYSSSYDDTIYLPGYDPFKGDEATHNISEYYKPGVGPVGFYLYDYLKDYADSSSWTTIRNIWNFSLVSTSLTSDDNFVFPQPPWKVFSDMPQAKIAPDAVVANNTIYLMAGRDSSYNALTALYKLESDGSWSSAKSIPSTWSTISSSTGAFVKDSGSPGEAIYLTGKFGGYNSTYRYLPSTNTWSLYSSSNLQYTHYDSFSWGTNYIYSLGLDGRLLEYNISTDNYTTLGIIDDDLTYLSVIADDEKIITVGQYEPWYNNFTTGMFINTGSGWSTNQWYSDSKRRWEPALAFYNNRLYIFGGGQDDEAKKVVSCVISGTTASNWKTHSPMLYGGTRLDAVVLDDKIYLFGCDEGKKIEIYTPEND